MNFESWIVTFDFVHVEADGGHNLRSRQMFGLKIIDNRRFATVIQSDNQNIGISFSESKQNG